MMTGHDVEAQVSALLGCDRHEDAARLLMRSAEAGDPLACAKLAEWRIIGNVIHRDLISARKLLASACDKGNYDAALLYASFLAAGVGGHEDWQAAKSVLGTIPANEHRAQVQLRLLREMKLDSRGFPNGAPAGRQLAEVPMIVAFQGFATAEECNYLRKVLEGALTPSVVIDPGSGEMIPHPIRSSDGAVFGVFHEDLVVNALNRRIAAVTRTDVRQGEPLQMLRYRAGGEYKAHLDALPPGDSQRTVTHIIYLSDDYTGGETHFARAGLTFRGRMGDALLFHNVRPNGSPDPLALHAGLPVKTGEKVIATRWIRDRAFRYQPPQPLFDI